MRAAAEENQDENFLDKIRRLRLTVQGDSFENLVSIFIAINFLFLYMRPQEILAPLAVLRIPVIISTIPTIFWLSRANQTWTFQSRLMLFFLIAEGFRTVIGKFVFDDFVINDFWQRQLWKDLFLNFSGLFFPLIAFSAHGRSLKHFTRAWCLATFYISLFAITHGGVGPGGFVSDENDTGFTLLSLLPVPLALATEMPTSFASSLRLLLLSFFTVLATIVTFSRGAFLGLVSVCLYFFWRSQRKLLLLILFSIIVAGSIPFIPKQYVDEIYSIEKTDEGTGAIRLHYWKIATRVFLDPRNILIGVGLGNTMFHLEHYETAQDLQEFPSSGGRKTHSIYFEVLPDLGTWGIFVFSSLFLVSFRSNARLQKAARKKILAITVRSKTKQEIGEKAHLLEQSLEEALAQLRFISPIFVALNVSYVAVFTSGAFISVAYYPPFWLLAAFSATLERYAQRLFVDIDNLLVPAEQMQLTSV